MNRLEARSSQSLDSLAGKSALVTGSSRGIGRAIAERFARRGALVAIHYLSNAELAADVVSSIERQGGRAFAFGAPLGGDDDVERFWAEFNEQRGACGYPDTGLDILVNNVGVAAIGEFESVTRADLDWMYAVNSRAPFFLVQQGLKWLRDGGRIINVSSSAVRMALPEVIGYCMTKGALDTFSVILAKELGGRGITVNSVAPGFTDTDKNADWLREPQAWAATAAKSALGKVGQPEDIADIVAFLASDAARWITGQVIDASGGTRL